MRSVNVNDSIAIQGRIPNIMVYIQAYLLCSLLLFIFGPVKWKTVNLFPFYSLVLIYQLSLFAGYYLANRTRSKIAHSKIYLLNRFVLMHLTLGLTVTLVFSLLMLIRRATAFSSGSFIETIYKSVINPSTNYFKRQSVDVINSFGGKYLTALIPLIAPVTMGSYILAIINFEKLKRYQKFLVVTIVIIQLSTSILSGTSEGIFEIGILTSVAAYINAISTKSYRIFKVNGIVVVLSIVLLLIAFFGFNMIKRTAGTFNVPISSNTIVMELKNDNSIMDTLKKVIVYLDIYLCQGYYGMSLCTQLNWYPTLGLGYSMYIQDNIASLLNLDIRNKTFMSRGEVFDWGSRRNWHTVYTWLSNDLSWYGVIILMFFIGWFIARLYRAAVNANDPIASVLLCLMGIFIVFLPANNKLFAQPNTFVAFWFYLFIWMIMRIGPSKSNKHER